MPTKPFRGVWLWAFLLLLAYVWYELSPATGLDVILVILFVYLAALAYRCIYNRSVLLYMDDVGVWVSLRGDALESRHPWREMARHRIGGVPARLRELGEPILSDNDRRALHAARRNTPQPRLHGGLL